MANETAAMANGAAAAGGIAETAGGAMSDRELGALPPMRIAGEAAPAQGGSFAAEAQSAAWAAREAEAAEAFAGMPTEDVRRRLEYARLEGQARLMLSAPERYGDEEFGALFGELCRRRFIADDRTLAAFDAADAAAGAKPSGLSRLREYVAFSERMAAAADEDARAAVVEERFMSPEMRAWREAKGRGPVAAAEFARARLKERGRAWGDRVAELRAATPNPNEVLDAWFGGRDGVRVPTLGELWGEDPVANGERMAREYERTLDGEAMRLEAQKVMPHLSEAQRRLVNLAASGADMGEFRGLFMAMGDSDRDLMLSLVQAVRPAWEGNFLAEMGVRAAMGVRSAWRAVHRADAAATDFILNGLGTFATGRTDLWSTPEEREALRRGMLADMQFDEMAGDLKLKDPEGFVDKALQGFADSAHLQYSMLAGEALRRVGAAAGGTATPAGRAAVVGGAALEGFAAASMIGEEFDNMLRRGVALDRAAPLAVCGGLVDAWVERWDLKSWLGRDLAPGELRRVGLRAAFRAAAKMDGREFLRVLRTNARQAVRIAEGELKEEVVQGFNQEGWASVAEGRGAVEAFTSSAAYAAGMDSLWEALPVCTAFGVFGAANPTGSVSRSARGAYAERFGEFAREAARRRGAETLTEMGMARAERAAREEAARVARATAGMSAKERDAWLSAQEGMSPAMRQFLADHCGFYEALAAQDGRAFADAVLSGSVDEAVFAKAGLKIGHGADGRIDSVETADGQRFAVEWRDGAATAEDLGEAGVRDLVAEWRRLKGETVDPSDAERVAEIAAEKVNGYFRDGRIVLFGANADTGTLSHETTHALVDALARAGTEEARRAVAALAEALGGAVGADGRLSVDADEALAYKNEHDAREAAIENRKGARPDAVLWRNVAANAWTALRRAVRLGGGRAFLPVVRTMDGVAHDPAKVLRGVVAEGEAALAAREDAERERAAELARIREEFARPAPNREEKRRAKAEARRAERDRRAEEARRREEEGRAERERRAVEEAEARFEEEFRRLEEEEASEEERRAEEARRAEMDARALENRKRALSRPPRLGWSKNQTGEDAQRARAAYLVFWRANAGQAVPQADVDRLEDVYGVPPEAVGLERTEGGWRLTGRQPLSDEAMYRFQDGLVRLWADLKSVKIIVPDVVVATAEEAAAAVPNEVWDPVSGAFVQGRVVVDPANAKSFREQAGLPEGDGADGASATPAEVMAELPPERPAAETWTAERPATPDVPGARYYRVALPNSDARLVGRLEVRDAADGVLTSTDAGYHDRANQNRDDASEESRQLVERIGTRPDPLQVATVQPMAGNGVVWVLPDGDVVIGNHRVNGVRRGYEKGTAGALERFVREDAARRGIPVPRDCRRPLTVFVLERIESPDGKTDVHEVVRLANESQNRGFNVRERASNDAKILLDNGLLARMAFRPDGRVDERRSADAIGPFRRASGAQGLLAEDGSLTEEGQSRLQNAALAALLGGAADNALLGKVMANAGRLDMAPELRGLMRAAPELLSIAAAKPRYDLRGPLAEALGRFVEWRDRDEAARLEKGKTRRAWRETRDGRRVRGLAWEEFAAQGDLFSKPSEEAAILGELFAAAESMRSFDREDAESEAGRARVFRLVSDYLSDYAANARAVNTETVDMFGSMPATRAEVLAAQRAKADGAGRTRFSIAQLPTGEKFVLLDRPNGIDWNDKNKVREYLATLVGTGAVSLVDGRRIEIGKDLPDEYTRSKYAEKAFRNVRLRKVRAKAAQHFDELIAVSGERTAEPARHRSREGGVYYRRNADFAVFGHEVRRGYSAELVTYEENGQERLYDLVNVKDKPSLVPDSATGGNGGFEILSTYNGEGEAPDGTPRIIPQSGAGRGRRFSIGGLYTGSAADYDSPSLHYVGSGSGLAVYGWGLYASTEREVAERYASANGIGRGHVYEQTFFTDRMDGDESRLLKWDEPPGAEQRELLRDGLKGLGGERRMAAVDFVNGERKLDLDRDGLTWEDVEGEDAPPEDYPDDVLFDHLERYLQLESNGGGIYRQLAEAFGSPKAASEFLAEAGIDGVKYPADGGVGWNYVSFRDDNVVVDHKWTDGEMRFSVRIAPEYEGRLTFGRVDERTAKATVDAWRKSRTEFVNRRNSRAAEFKSDWSKVFSSKAKGQSDSYEAHYAAANNLKALFENGVKYREEKPRNGSADIAAYAKYACPFAVDGVPHLAKITVKEYPAGGGAKDGVYSVEAISAEKIGAGGNNAAISRIRGQSLDSDAINALGEMLRTSGSIPQSGAEREAAGQDTRFSVVSDRKTLDWFDGAEKISTYRTFVRIGGKLYSPVRTRVGGKLTEPVELGTLYKADERPETAHLGKLHSPRPKDGGARESDGKWYVDLDKGRDGTLYDIAYNPYWHSSNLALNDQFTSAWRRDLVTVRCEIAREDVESGYRAERAHSAVGRMDWHKGTVAKQLDADNDRYVYLSRFLRPVEVLSDDETAALYVDAFKGRTDFRVDGRVVTPGLARALRARGVDVSPSPAERAGAAGKTRFSLAAPSELVGAMDRRAERAARPRPPDGPSPYFEEAAGAMDFPLAALRTLKDEPEASVRNAARRMDEAAAGIRARRAPLTLADRGDGTFTVVDGTATALAAARRGMPAVRGIVAGRDRGTRLANSAYLVQSENADAPLLSRGADTLDAALANAAENADALEAVVRAAAAKTGGEAVMRPPDAETGKPTKGRASAERKLRDECGGDVSLLVDLVGGTVVLDDGADFSDALKAIRAALPDGASVARVKKLNLDTSDSGVGYRDVKVSVRFANGGIGEVILIERFMNDAKFNRGGHAVYEITRILKKYEGLSQEVDAARSDLKKLSEAIYGRGADAVTPAYFARMKAKASSSMTRLNLPDNATANSSSDMAELKKLVLGLNLATISQSSNATPASSLMKNIGYSFADYGGNVANNGASVNPARSSVAADTRLARSARLVENENADAPLLSRGADTLDAALANAAENADALEAVVRAAAAKTGGEAVMRPPDAETGKPTKGRASAERKLRDECGGDVSLLVDLVGGTVVLDDGADFSDALKAIRAALPDGASVARVKKLNLDTSDSGVGYRDVKVSVRFANGGIGEVILVERFVNDAKFNRGGHAVYEIARILKKYEKTDKAVADLLDDLDDLTEAIYGRGADAVTAEHFARMKARASSSMTCLQGPDRATRLSPGVMNELKKLSSGLNLAKPPSVNSYATPASSLMKNIGYSFDDYGGNVANGGASVNPADEAVAAARRLGRPRRPQDADPERPSRLFSISDCSPMGIAKHLLARSFIEERRPPSDERVKRVARATGYVGDMDALRVAAEREAEYQRTLFRVIETDPKISRLLARAGLAARNERRAARARSAAVQYSREVSEAARRSRRAAECAARMMRGEDYEQMVAREGLDMEAILLAIRPEERRPAGAGSGERRDETPPGPAKPLSEDERRALADAVRQAVANGAALVGRARAEMAARRAQEAERAAAAAARKAQNAGEAADDAQDAQEGDGGGGGGGGGADEGGGAVAEAFRRAVREAGLTLDSPEAMVQLVKAVTEKYVRDFPREFPTADPAEPWSSPLVQARFASNLAEFARAVAAAYAPSYARIRIARRAQLLDDRSLRTVRQIEEAGEALFRDLHDDVLRQTRSEIVGEIKKILRPHAKNWRPNVERQERKGVESALGRWCTFAYRAIEMSAEKVEERSRKLEDELRSWAGTAESEAERYREFADRKTELEALDMFGHLRGRMPAELADLRDHVRQVVDESRFEEMQFGERWERSRAAAAEAAEEEALREASPAMFELG